MKIEKIIEDYGQSIYRISCCYTDSTEEQEDLVQEILIAVWKSLKNFRKESSLKTYVYRISKNHAISYLIKKKKSFEYVELTEEGSLSIKNPESELLSKENFESIIRKVKTLPLGLRQVFSLYLEGLNYSEISEVLSISKSSVGVRLHRAKKHLSSIKGESLCKN